jgi:hypothetical protein
MARVKFVGSLWSRILLIPNVLFGGTLYIPLDMPDVSYLEPGDPDYDFWASVFQVE